LISLKIKNYNCNIATKEFDLWAIVLVFAFLEGYRFIYDLHIFDPLERMLKYNDCIIEKAFNIEDLCPKC